jgi:uncharacterized repeat protein (TIGR03803 family)
VIRLRNDAVSERVLYTFQSGNDAAFPMGTLIADANNALYGTSTGGGLTFGTVYKLTPSGSGYAENVLYAFTGGIDGADPSAGLLGDSSGALYGTTSEGGNLNCNPTVGCGTVYKLTPSGSGYTKNTLYEFGSHPGDGKVPSSFGPLVADATGALYGTTIAGGNKFGTIFKLTLSGSIYTESIVHDFTGGNGAFPIGGMLLKGGALYGTSEGNADGGSVWKLTPSGAGYRFKVLYAFKGAPDGDNPDGTPIADNSGALYGSTVAGGTGACSTGCGTVFRLTPSGSGYTETILYSFQGVPDGTNPIAGVIADSRGDLYGTTDLGGSTGYNNSCFPNGCGTVFKLTPSGSVYTETSFAFDDLDGSIAIAGLTRVNGNLYGVTQSGYDGSPTTFYGIAFKITF